MRRLTNFVRGHAENFLDDIVAKALTRLETETIRPGLARARRRATRDFGIGAGVLLLALGAHFFLADDTLALALAAAACWYSILTFVWNRVGDVKTYLAYREPIDDVTGVALPVFFRAKLGTKFHSAGEAIYNAVYEGRLTFENTGTGRTFQVGRMVRGAHRAASAMGLVPDKGEVFEQVYAQMLRLFRRLVRSVALGVASFFLAYAALTSVIRIVVEDFVSGARLSGLFDPIVFPVTYVMGFVAH